MRSLSHILWNDDEGQNIAEYALIVAVMVLSTIAAITAFWLAVNRIGQ